MSKVKNPLHSLTAQGAVGRLLTYHKYRGLAVARKHSHPKQPNTSDQLTWRTMYQAAIALWHGLSASEKADWERVARPHHMNGFPFFMSSCLKPNPGIYLPLAGGTMTGPIAMSAQKITGLDTPTDPADAARKAEITAHNALVLSHLTHDNDNNFEGYGNETVDGIPSSSDLGSTPGCAKAPALAAISDPLTKRDVSDWYGASGAYRQADADSTATYIEDDTANFPASIRNTMVKWASNAAGTLNTGIGFIKYRTDADTLQIAKCTGDDFAASYYYWIKHSEWVIPVTGIYIIECSVLALPAELATAYQAYLCTYSGTSAPTLNAQFALSSSVTAYCLPAGCTFSNLTKDHHIYIGLSHNGTSGVPALYTTAPSHIRLRLFLLKQTA